MCVGGEEEEVKSLHKYPADKYFLTPLKMLKCVILYTFNRPSSLFFLQELIEQLSHVQFINLLGYVVAMVTSLLYNVNKSIKKAHQQLNFPFFFIEEAVRSHDFSYHVVQFKK